MTAALDPALVDGLIDAERARRCVERGTCATLWYRAPTRYKPGRWHRQIGAVCDDIASGILTGRAPWVALSAPPRHGKTEHVARGLPARLMALSPGASVLYATSTDDRAIEVSLAVRGLVERLSVAYPHLRPSARWTATDWVTVGGNQWIGVGAGSATGGIGARLLVTDDVTGSAERQASEAWKRRARVWLQEDILTRGLPGAGWVNMETRRGLDDTQGWASETYGERITEHVWRCRAEEGDTDGRPPGELLWPEGGYDEAWLAGREDLRLGGRVWDTLYQQRPTQEGGEVIRSDWTAHRYAGDPMVARRSCQRVIIAVDPSASTRDTADPTAIQVWGTRGRLRLLLYAETIRPHDLTQRLIDLRATWRPDAIVIERTSIGEEIARQLQQRGTGGVVTVPVPGGRDKVARMTPYLPSWQAGDVQLPEGQPWVAPYVHEMVSVPRAAHDDQWDATTIALAYLADAEPQEIRSVRGVW